MWRIVSILYALWTISSKVFGILWALLSRSWWVLLIVIVMLLTVYPQMQDAVAFLKANWAWLYTAVQSGGADASALASAGWPSWLADGFAFVDHILPISEALAMFGVLLALYVSMAAFRMLKSLLPVITG